MSKRRNAARAQPKVQPEARPAALGNRIEALARFRHDGSYRNPGDVIETTASDAAELIALGFAKAA